MLSYLRATVVLLACLTLASCSAVQSLGSGQVSNVNPRIVYELRAGYDTAFLPLAVQYKRLKYCPPGTHFSKENPCKEKIYVQKLQQADMAVVKALDNLQKVSMSGDTLTFGLAYQSAQIAIQGATDIFTVYKLK